MQESTYRQLIAWQKAVDLCVSLYEFADSFPRAERFALTSQLRRAGVSVPSNIAEGRGRGTPREYRRFLLQARGSLYEIETQTMRSGSGSLSEMNPTRSSNWPQR